MKRILALVCLLAVAGCWHDQRPQALQKEPVTITATRMQDLVISISRYAKSKNPGFLIVPQNASKLVYRDGDPYGRKHPHYQNSIDAIGIEGLFYNAGLEPDSLRIAILDTLSKKMKVFVSDFVENDADAAKNRQMIEQQGFVPFVRKRANFDYVKIPAHSGKYDAPAKIADVTHYLYLINGGEFADKQSFIEAVAKTSYQMAIIDIFFHGEAFTAGEIAQIKKMPGGGNRILLGYVNVGAAENWRYYWQQSWKIGSPRFLARPYHGYKDEVWVKYWDPQWKQILYGNPESYIDRMVSSGFDGAYLDNVEAYLYLYGND